MVFAADIVAGFTLEAKNRRRNEILGGGNMCRDYVKSYRLRKQYLSDLPRYYMNGAGGGDRVIRDEAAGPSVLVMRTAG